VKSCWPRLERLLGGGGGGEGKSEVKGLDLLRD
jgi:hypothetical protein